MKHPICVVVLASLMSVPLSVMASPDTHKEDSQAAVESGQRRMADRMKEKLGLSDEQAKKLEAAWKEHREAVEPLREQLHKTLRKVHGVLEIEASDKDIQAALDQVEKARGALRAENERLKKTMETVLTATQRAKMMVMREKMMRHGMARGRGQRDSERCRHGGHGHGGWQEKRGRGEDRSWQHGSEDREDWAHDQEQEGE
jgi:Spy/CpxP family protein refolding chaperone